MIVVTVVTAVTAALEIESPIRHRALYAFDGALIMPEVSARGRTMAQVAGAFWLTGAIVGVLRVSGATGTDCGACVELR